MLCVGRSSWRFAATHTHPQPHLAAPASPDERARGRRQLPPPVDARRAAPVGRLQGLAPAGRRGRRRQPAPPERVRLNPVIPARGRHVRRPLSPLSPSPPPLARGAGRLVRPLPPPPLGGSVHRCARRPVRRAPPCPGAPFPSPASPLTNLWPSFPPPWPPSAWVFATLICDRPPGLFRGPLSSPWALTAPPPACPWQPPAGIRPPALGPRRPPPPPRTPP